MPLSDIHSPTHLPPVVLDTYLANGWFRMGQQLFTTQFLHFNDTFYSAFWLRIDLMKWTISKSQEALLRRVDQQFTVSIDEYHYAPIDDQLFEKYRLSIHFEHSHSIQQLLSGTADYQIFHTRAIRIWDQEKLIGLGFFDEGVQCIAGISCLYDPDYRKYSLGKYMMIQKMRWAKQSSKRFFYPGYCAPGYRLFDYKLALAPAATYYFKLTSQRWNRWSDSIQLPIEIIEHKLQQLSEVLSQRGVAHVKLSYPYYDTNTAAHLRRFNLFDQPILLALYSTQTHQFPIVYFDFIQGCFQLRKAQKFFSLNPEQPVPSHTFTEAILKAHIVFFIHSDPEIMASFIQNNIRFWGEHFEFKTTGYIDRSE